MRVGGKRFVNRQLQLLNFHFERSLFTSTKKVERQTHTLRLGRRTEWAVHRTKTLLACGVCVCRAWSRFLVFAARRAFALAHRRSKTPQVRQHTFKLSLFLEQQADSLYIMDQLSQLTPEQKQMVMAKAQQEANQQIMQQMLEKMNTACFEKCIGTPSVRLTLCGNVCTESYPALNVSCIVL